MNKYIIKNCPAILRMSKVCDDYRTTRDNPQLCKDITDCLLKRIVFFCKMDVRSKDNMFLISRYALADLILEMLDIEEVDE